MIVPTAIPESFHILQFIGFIFLVIGTVIHNEVLIIPFWGFNHNTKEARFKRAMKPEADVNNKIVVELKLIK